MPALRERDNGPVLRDDGIHESKVTGHPSEVIENTTSDDRDGDAPLTRLSDRAANLWVEYAALSDGTVVIEREDSEPH